MEQIWVCIEKICWKTWQISKHLQIVVAFWLCQMIVFSPLVVCMVVHLEMFWLWTTYIYFIALIYQLYQTNKLSLSKRKCSLPYICSGCFPCLQFSHVGNFAPYQCWNLMCSSQGYEFTFGLVLFMFFVSIYICI